LEKSRRLIKVPLVTAVYDVSGVAAFNSISSNPILLSTCRLLGQGKGGGVSTLSLWSYTTLVHNDPLVLLSHPHESTLFALDCCYICAICSLRRHSTSDAAFNFPLSNAAFFHVYCTCNYDHKFNGFRCSMPIIFNAPFVHRFPMFNYNYVDRFLSVFYTPEEHLRHLENVRIFQVIKM
jgi:hypothetical protein